MSKRTKSGQGRRRSQIRARLKRRVKRKKAALLAAGHIKKGPSTAA
jgi:hypothetical protein